MARKQTGSWLKRHGFTDGTWRLEERAAAIKAKKERETKMAKAKIPGADRLVPPTDNLRPLITTDELVIEHARFEAAVAEIERAVPDIPDRIDDDVTSGEWQDVVSRITVIVKQIEANREAVKSPYLTAGRVVDGFFKGFEKRCLEVNEKVRAPIASYLRRKADEERQRREAEAAAARAESIRLQREAEEARQREETAKRQATQERHAQAAREAEAGAEEAQERAAYFERASHEKSADLSRTRSRAGSLASLDDHWDFEVADYAKLKGSALWPYVTNAAKEAAIKAYMKANAPGDVNHGPWQPLDGVRFFKTSKLKVR